MLLAYRHGSGETTVKLLPNPQRIVMLLLQYRTLSLTQTRDTSDSSSDAASGAA